MTLQLPFDYFTVALYGSFFWVYLYGTMEGLGKGYNGLWIHDAFIFLSLFLTYTIS